MNKKPRPILYSCGNDRVGFAIVNLFGESLPKRNSSWEIAVQDQRNHHSLALFHTCSLHSEGFSVSLMALRDTPSEKQPST